MVDSRHATAVLAILTALSLYLSYLLFRPFLAPILFAVVVAIVFHPLQVLFRKMFRNRSVVALASTLSAMLITAVPLFFLALAVSAELSDLYRSAATKTASHGGPIAYLFQALDKVVAWAGRHLPLPPVDLSDLAMRRLGEASSSLLRIGAGLVSNLFALITNAVIATVALFFIFRDGEAGLARVCSALPLPAGSLARLQERVSSTIVANLYGGVAVSAAQGLFTGLAFWALGIGSPVLWGVVTGVVSLVPFVGSAIVWAPASLVLIADGHLAKGIVLLAWGAGVVGLVDNVIRPWIISERVQLHPLYIFFALLGGVEMFGMIGLFVGPVVLSLAAALLGMLEEDIKMRSSARDG